MGDIHVGYRGEIAVITINSPGRLNAFTRAMRRRIVESLARVEKDPALAGAILTGAEDAFCAGQDFNESMTWTQDTPWIDEFEELYRGFLAFKKPLVAAVNGVAAGGGFQAALLCDYRVAHDDVHMGQTEVKWGLASVTGTWLLQKSVGMARARELALSGRLVTGQELLDLGLIDMIVPRPDVMQAALAACRNLAASPADSIARTKRWLYESVSGELSMVFEAARRLHREGFASGVSQAGAANFIARKESRSLARREESF
jgi:enoyl-CoA hydratase/carnithine racemase